MVRSAFIFIIFGFANFSGVAFADVVAHCNGRYAQAAKIIDIALARHQTLYSGGDHFHYSNDHVGATLDVYRLLIGAPDLELRVRKERNVAPWEDDGETLWANSSWVFDGKASGPIADADHSYAVLALDLLTSAGPAPDWWLKLDQLDKLGDRQKFVAETVPNAPALDWLQTVLAASDAPWAINWHLAPPDADYSAYERLAARAAARFETGGGLQWLVAASLIEPTWPKQRLDAVEKEVRRLKRAIQRCEATPAEYAAFSLADSQYRRRNVHPKSRVFDVLPKIVRERLTTQTAFQNVLDRWGSRGPKKNADFGFYDEVFAKKAAAEYFDLAKLYQSESSGEIPISSNAYVLRAYNALSIADLALLAGREGAPPSVAGAAFARSIALGRWKQAIAFIDRMKAAFPDRADEIDGYWNLNAPERARLALIAIHIPVSTHICGGTTYGDYALTLYHRNVCAKSRELPLEYVGLGALQRDLEVWFGERPGAYRHMHGFSVPAVQRRHYRHGGLRRTRSYHVHNLLGKSYTLTLQSPSDRVPAFVNLVAWDEIGRLVQRDRFMPMTASILVNWAGEKTRGRDRLLDEKANALARLIRLCRYDDCGEIDGAPAQARAYKILHRRFPDTDAAKDTPYWWESRRT